MYSRERDFSRALVSKLKSFGADVTRIETHGTGNGVPDMFVQIDGDDCWIELKNCPTVSIFNRSLKIPYRPGQQAWLYGYTRRHMGMYLNKCALTIVALCDGVLVLRNNHLVKDNMLNFDDDDCFIFTTTQWKQLALSRFCSLIYAYSRWNTTETYRDNIVKYMSDVYYEKDYDPDVLFDSFNNSNEYVKSDLDIDGMANKHVLKQLELYIQECI